LEHSAGSIPAHGSTVNNRKEHSIMEQFNPDTTEQEITIAFLFDSIQRLTDEDRKELLHKLQTYDRSEIVYILLDDDIQAEAMRYAGRTLNQEEMDLVKPLAEDGISAQMEGRDIAFEMAFKECHIERFHPEILGSHYTHYQDRTRQSVIYKIKAWDWIFEIENHEDTGITILDFKQDAIVETLGHEPTPEAEETLMNWVEELNA
jgi:hypothetical protein